jgi:hypothetical protein
VELGPSLEAVIGSTNKEFPKIVWKVHHGLDKSLPSVHTLSQAITVHNIQNKCRNAIIPLDVPNRLFRHTPPP